MPIPRASVRTATDVQTRSRFTAKGDAVASLDCEENYWENANWTIGEIYSRRDVTCDLVDFSVPVKEIEGIARV